MKEINLTEGSIFAKLVQFSLPMIAGNLLQQVYNLVDTLIVGKCIGSDVLAPRTPLGVVAIWLSIPIGWVLADLAGLVFYCRLRPEIETALSQRACRGCPANQNLKEKVIYEYRENCEERHHLRSDSQ